MIAIILSLLLAIVAAQDDTCPGGITNGATVERGRYWYECQKGQLVPRGCLTEDNRRIDVGGTYDSNSYRMQCSQDRDGYLTIVFKGCVYNGQEYAPEESWDDVKYVYACIRQADQLRIEVAGCLDQGRRVGINEKVTRGSFVYQCLKTKNGTCSMCPVGCSKDNHEYGLGDTFERGDFWYTCIRDTDNNRKIAIKPSGCMNEGRRFNHQEHFRKGDIVFECFARDGEAKAVASGCVHGDQESRIGETWYEGSAPMRYEMICKGHDQENVASKAQKRCFYDTSAGQLNVEGGCYRILGDTGVGCLKDSSGQLEIRALRMQDLEQAGTMGLHFCP